MDTAAGSDSLLPRAGSRIQSNSAELFPAAGVGRDDSSLCMPSKRLNALRQDEIGSITSGRGEFSNEATIHHEEHDSRGVGLDRAAARWRHCSGAKSGPDTGSPSAPAGQRTDGQIEMDVVHALDASAALKDDLITAATIQGAVFALGNGFDRCLKELANRSLPMFPGSPR